MNVADVNMSGVGADRHHCGQERACGQNPGAARSRPSSSGWLGQHVPALLIGNGDRVLGERCGYSSSARPYSPTPMSSSNNSACSPPSRSSSTISRPYSRPGPPRTPRPSALPQGRQRRFGGRHPAGLARLAARRRPPVERAGGERDGELLPHLAVPSSASPPRGPGQAVDCPAISFSLPLSAMIAWCRARRRWRPAGGGAGPRRLPWTRRFREGGEGVEGGLGGRRGVDPPQLDFRNPSCGNTTIDAASRGLARGSGGRFPRQTRCPVLVHYLELSGDPGSRRP